MKNEKPVAITWLPAFICHSSLFILNYSFIILLCRHRLFRKYLFKEGLCLLP
jgi:hypothetical protein